MKTKQIITQIITIATVGITSLFAGCGSRNTAQAPEPKSVKVKLVETRSSVSTVRYSASIRPGSQVDVSFKVGGYIETIARQQEPGGEWRHIQAGDTVRQGEVLARVRQSDFAARVNEVKSQHGEARSALDTNNAQLQEAKAAVETSRAQVKDAESYFERTRLDFERAQALFATQSITKPDYDAAKAQYETAKAKLEAARAQLEVAKARVAVSETQVGMAQSKIKTAEASIASATIPLQDTQLKAPMSAVVIERKIETGALVSAGTTGFVLADLTSVKAAFGVPDLALQSFKLGDTLSMTTDGVPGTEFSGHISRISPAADQSSRVFDVEVTIANPQGLLKPGMIASLTASEGPGAPVQLSVIPLTAVTRSKLDASAYAVFVIDDQAGKQIAHERNITLGESFGNSVAVLSGLRAGETVITTGATQVADGEEVNVIQ